MDAAPSQPPGSGDAAPSEPPPLEDDWRDAGPTVPPPPPPLPPPSGAAAVCPDGVCDPAEGCTACPADCGACPAVCPNGNCEPGETCADCPADCRDCGTCPNGACDAGEDCRTCAADCGACPAACGVRPCVEGERCVSGPATPDPFCTRCDPAACGVFGTPCCPHNADTAECTNWWADPNHCGACDVACAAGQRCVSHVEPVFIGPFCTACDPDACAAFGVRCCPGTPGADCTRTDRDAANCGGCGVQCPEDQLCVRGICQAPEVARDCGFDPMQWWSSPGAHDQRDITFVAFGDPHATEHKEGGRRVDG